MFLRRRHRHRRRPFCDIAVVAISGISAVVIVEVIVDVDVFKSMRRSIIDVGVRVVIRYILVFSLALSLSSLSSLSYSLAEVYIL